MPTTPSMGLVLPVPTTTLGPEWATELNEALETVDQHDHTVGKGNQVPSAGLNIDAELSFGSNSAIDLRSAQFTDQSPPLSGVAEAASVQFSNGDLWITNGAGVAVQVTSGTSVVAPSSSNTPAGIVLPYAGSSAPAGYLLCDGSAVNRVTYATLFGVIGETYGPGDGVNTFNLPDMQGRSAVGAGTYTDTVLGSVTRTLGQVLGAAAHVLGISEMPSHTHQVTITKGFEFSTSDLQAGNNTQSPAQVGETVTSGTAGTGSAHNNMQPSLGLNYIIKT